MSQIQPAEPHHEQFVEWAKNSGVEINGVGPAKILGRGLGIVAERAIEVHDLHVPDGLQDP